MPRGATRSLSHHEQIYRELRQSLERGECQAGEQLPTDAALCRQYGVSRPTVARALNRLRDEGRVDRRPGSGTFVCGSPHAQAAAPKRMFGLLIPGLGETEIFEPICGQMASLADTLDFGLLWGNAWSGVSGPGRGGEMQAACQRFVDQGMAGVFFAPLEWEHDASALNRTVLSALRDARIPVVLLDREPEPFPGCSDLDLVSVDNYRGSFVLTRHFLSLGCTRVDFLALPYSAETVLQRVAGYRQALLEHGTCPSSDWIHVGDPTDPEFVSSLVTGGTEAVICANDATAATLLATLGDLDIGVPADIRVAGFDDVKYASLLRVPLTTLRQPCRKLGTVAVHTMLERIAHPYLPARKILLEGDLVIRRSCGAEPGPPC